MTKPDIHFQRYTDATSEVFETWVDGCEDSIVRLTREELLAIRDELNTLLLLGPTTRYH